MDKKFDRRVELVGRDRIHDGFVKLDKIMIRHSRFDGTMSKPLEREVIIRRPAAAVLPYDPLRDRIILIEQFRPAPYLVEGPSWMIELVAGLIDPGESPEQTVRREALEEAGLTIGRLARIGAFYSSQGACTEKVTCFCGEVDSTRAEGLFGAKNEDEDIRAYSVPADRFVDEALSGKLDNATALVCGLWFAAMRARGSGIWTA
ncbi:NUDIX domain-containing protein [Fodinicurvata sp. EGI_FJ10296]|uniref:NUDIX domain-containing protein n=1 Tax=Fodinicurvata sp. EGI_FJ10296 TaxID=3231908 RepID=UPI00345361C8